MGDLILDEILNTAQRLTYKMSYNRVEWCEANSSSNVHSKFELLMDLSSWKCINRVYILLSVDSDEYGS